MKENYYYKIRLHCFIYKNIIHKQNCQKLFDENVATDHGANSFECVTMYPHRNPTVKSGPIIHRIKGKVYVFKLKLQNMKKPGVITR